jgi:hypothetical protein
MTGWPTWKSCTAEEVEMDDPEQVAVWKTVQILLNKVIFAESYLEQELAGLRTNILPGWTSRLENGRCPP